MTGSLTIRSPSPSCVNIHSMKKAAFILCALTTASLSIFQGHAQQEKYIKYLKFPPNSTLEQKIDLASRLVPSPQQLAWQKMELTAFLHFGINTFTGREWGNGTDSPKVFNPTSLDAMQWVRTLKNAGFKMVILTAKHHDGFCLWPTKTTSYSVASSPWKNGKGDVVKELREACDKYDMKFGIYLSPWDRNAPCYGNSPAYNQFFIEQLSELLTNYGEIHEVWFDGANGEGPNGKKQIYDWEKFYATIKRLQPHAVTAIMGDDVRWVGNEKGLGRETEWSATVLTPGVNARAAKNNSALGINGKSKDLGSKTVLSKAHELFWYPSEVDVSIRPGWFYHERENNKVKSLKQLTDIYFQSVGYNSVLLLNIPPDTRGLIHSSDSIRLEEFAQYLQQTFKKNYIHEGEQLWQPLAGEDRTYCVQDDSPINVIMLQEDISQGQRVESFSIEALTNNQWKPIAQGTTIGHKRLVRIPAICTSTLKIRINETRCAARICNVAAYYAQPVQETTADTIWNNLPRDSWKLISVSPLIIDLGKQVTLSEFTYAPQNAVAKPTMAYRYQFSISTDGIHWTQVITDGEFSNIMHNPLPQTVTLPQKEKARYIQLKAVSPDGNDSEIHINEIGVTVSF